MSTSGDGGAPDPISGGEGGAPPPPPNCDTTKLPTEDPCVIHEGVGVFVSSSLGTDGGDGSQQKPLRSIKAGVALAKATSRRVYVCAESYTEAVTLEDGVSLFGYFDCSAGFKVKARRATIASPTSPAITAREIMKPTRFEAFDASAPDAVTGSSVGMLAVRANALKVVDVRIHAGKGAAGADATDAPQLTDSGSAKNGTDGSGDFTCNTMTFACIGGPSAAGGTNACTGKISASGGAGGKGGAPSLQVCEFVSLYYVWVTKQNPGNGDPQPANVQTNQGGNAQSLASAQSGNKGKDGNQGAASAETGVFDPVNLYTPADGSAGTNGEGGQGGGGGYGQNANFSSGCDQNHDGMKGWGWVGGGGGAGGCPGLGADGGKGGGASVALLSFNSATALEGCVLESSSGGAGGKGGFASAGLAGGKGGAYGGSGDGGPGGDGGSGSNGSGGPSFALAYSGSMPSLVSTQTTAGAGGAGVPQRTQGSFTIPASANGKSAATYSF